MRLWLRPAKTLPVYRRDVIAASDVLMRHGSCVIANGKGDALAVHAFGTGYALTYVIHKCAGGKCIPVGCEDASDANELIQGTDGMACGSVLPFAE
jgi:hypothetical protein